MNWRRLPVNIAHCKRLDLLPITISMNRSCINILEGCPGKYCGRLLQNSTYCEPICGACPIGYRLSGKDICLPCNDDANPRDYMYFIFMVLITLSGHLLILAMEMIQGKRIKTRNIVITACSCVLECGLASIITLLLFEPYGNLVIKSCGAKEVSDFYPIFYNPVPDFVHEIDCVSEVVHPLYTFIFVFLGFNLLFLIAFRVPLAFFIRHSIISRTSIFYSLIGIPSLVLFHAVFAGLIYFSFEYLSIIAGTVVFAVVSVRAQRSKESGMFDDKVSFTFGLKLWKNPLYLSFSAVCVLYIMVGILGLTNEIDSDTLRLQLLPLALAPFLSFPILSLFAVPDHYLTAWGVPPDDYNGPLE